ncbi:RNA polymerase sigma factor [Blastopirellula retiformator]|uniref:ECF RNA polymerase sigma-E factor n=1 Tax=Blastopirellula retiformator TaxID=2527970 RepID=A0A5C5V2U3_9BACT|nr:sigma-70 family RNA polymerase sigma factor [Blastopirellula retiformator]TWT32701.1 ECF RNA polymerase sigma-E factor [Blastopirellula retiformator]
MSEVSETDVLLIDRIRTGDADAWTDLIGRYEGRLLAFAESRLRRRAPSEDVVQETFIGFLNSLPNYDGKRSLESYLFAICAYKLTDHLRREGRRPTLPIHSGGDGSSDNWELPGTQRAASSIVRSGERRDLEEAALVEAINGQLDHWRGRGDWVKVQCLEMLLVRGYANKDVAELLDLTEQNVANYKFDFLAKLRAAVRKQGLNEEIFPELYAAN